MNVGGVYGMTKCEVVAPDGSLRLGYKVPKRGDTFVFLFLGTEKKGTTLDPESALRSLGWHRLGDTAMTAKEKS